MRRKLSPAECMRAGGDGEANASGNPEVAATGDAGGPSPFGELVPADTKLIPPSLARSFGILEALLVAANEASNRSSDGSGSKGGSGPGTAGKFDSHGGLAETAEAGAAAHAPRRQVGGNRRRSTEQGGPAGDTGSGGLSKRRRTGTEADGGNGEREHGDDVAGVSAGAAAGDTTKKARLVWSPPLHKRFVDAVSYLGLVTAVPKRIMELMNVEGLTRENVASHLQKYRLYMKRLQTSSQGRPEEGMALPDDSEGEEKRQEASAAAVDGDDDT